MNSHDVGLKVFLGNKMKADKLTIGESYRHKDHPNYCWAKVVAILRPKEAENTRNRIIVKCEWSQNKNAKVGLIKYFKPSDLIDINANAPRGSGSLATTC